MSKRVPTNLSPGATQAQHRAAAPARSATTSASSATAEVGGAGLADGERQRRLAEHGRDDGVVDHHRQGEPAAEAHPDRPDAGAADLACRCRARARR